MNEEIVIRCQWVTKDPIYIKYHDEEWGRPQYDSVQLFEMLCLGGQQAGLSWITILKRRKNYQKAFYNFDPYKIAEITSEHVSQLLYDSSILRNRKKIESIINNAKCFIDIDKTKSFSDFIWSFVDYRPVVNNWEDIKEIPNETSISVALSKSLKKHGFQFVGATICYAFMQTCGLVTGRHSSIIKTTIPNNMSYEEEPVRCGWLSQDPLYIKYHDEEWGIPHYDSLYLFEMICLEGQQAGLSWLTILKKRENYRKLFYNFDPHKIIKILDSDINKLMQNTDIVRHRGKINAIINNAQCYINMENDKEIFSEFIWGFVNNKPIVNNWHQIKDIPTESLQSIALSKALKKRGFKFVGATICYAFMQACGLVNDHIIDCICRK